MEALRTGDACGVRGTTAAVTKETQKQAMRILHVICTTDAESGGPIEAIERLSAVLAREGHTIAVVSLEPQEIAGRRQYGFACTVVGVGAGRGKYRYNPGLDAWLRAHAAEYDVVVAHGLWNYSSVGAWRALRRQKTPYVVFAHGMMDPWFRDGFPVKHLFKQAYWWAVEGCVLRDARTVLFTCEEEKLRARGVYRGHAYREDVARLGTAAPAGNAELEKGAFGAAFPQLAKRRFILFISRIHPKKGCDLLIEAFARCCAELPEDVDLVMAGPDQVGIAKDLRALTERLGVARRVHWTGMLRDELKWGALRTAEAMILPSHQENFGFVVAEAMACGTPVLISNKVNIWREVLEAQAGLVEPDTVEGTCMLLRKFAAMSRDERQRMRINAMEGFAHFFDVETAARELAQTLRRLCAKPAEHEGRT